MDANTVSNIQTLLGLILFFFIGWWYIIPALYKLDIYAALIPLLLFSAFRYLGLSFMVPTLSNGLTSTVFAVPAAYGDFAVGLLALVAALVLRARWSFGIILAWIYAVLGSADFIYAFYLSTQSELPERAGSLWLTLFLLGPAWMITLVLLFIVLIKHPRTESQANPV